ncbi:AAA family ATPase [Psychrobacter urativorans]|uniref:AAA family ATPase n=1 Tax=Psychrobacter urativorans TaxID=45610 RepID=UPI00191AEF7C|nr:ATP-binding protein [Psychrobacter urativorans]
MTDNASITIKNFKSYKDATLPLSPLTLLIGANASGKSNAIEAFRFLSWVAGGERLSTLKNRVNDSDKVVRGSIKDLAFNHENSFSLSFNYASNISYSGVFLNEDNQLYVVAEIYQEKENKLFFHRSGKYINLALRYLDASDTIKLASLKYILEVNKNSWIPQRFGDFEVAANFPDQDLSVLSMKNFYDVIWKGFHDTSQVSPININCFDDLTDFLIDTFFYDFVPGVMRQDSVSEKILSNSGSNLAGVLRHLCKKNSEYKEKILQLVQSLPEQDITDIKFYTDKRERVEFLLCENFGSASTERTMDLLSDGTLKVLGIAAALLSVPEGATVVIEEIDNSIHPTRAHEILSLLRQYAKERKLNLLLSTHNPALMDALPDEALADAVFCYRDPQAGDSKLVRLGDLDDYLGLVAQGSLGDLVTQGIVERFVKHPTTPEQRKKQALDWLSQLQGAD